jgi:radical SAM superfamily enzyme YgiQ (UPF0313 family)
MRILLIHPPVKKLQHRMSPNSWTERLGTYPPLGLMYLAAHLEARGHTVSILDLVLTGMDRRQLTNRLRSFAPDITGITCLTFNVLAALRIAETVKAACPHTITVVGGPHPTLYPRETAKQPGVDYVALGDGERSLTELARDPRSGASVPGLVSRETDSDIDLRKRIESVDRESIPFPARHLIDGRAYRSIVSKRLPMTSMVTGAGCPFRCLFCSVPQRQNPYSRSVEHVIQEMRHCQRSGYREIMFFDDIFTLNRDRTLELCRLIRENDIDVAWDCRTRVDCVDSEMLLEMKRSGCYRVQYGLESGSPTVLETLNKRFTLEQARRAVSDTRTAGISPSASFIIGNPGETASDIERTIEFALQSDPDFVQFTICTPFPSSPLYDRGLQTGFYPDDYWRQFAERPTESFVPQYWSEVFTPHQLRIWQNRAFRRFYYRPGYILRQMMSVRSPSEAGRKIGLSLRLAMETALTPAGSGSEL